MIENMDIYYSLDEELKLMGEDFKSIKIWIFIIAHDQVTCVLI